ncbi:hypothetical protein G7054_g7813 [Neopestalotiopsis clavispora]|nr:hypothetical protein G7054_g7813 [Neopestalotiopsis clavispora]
MQAPGWRQQPGFACEECRRRKARCDRRQPRCSSCIDSGADCVTVMQRPRRGPKKGQLDMMRSRIAVLESELQKKIEPSVGQPSPMDIAAPEESFRKTSMASLENCSWNDINLISDAFLDQTAGSADPYLNWSQTTPTMDIRSTFGSSEESNNQYPMLTLPMVFEDISDTENVSVVKSGDSKVDIPKLMLVDLDDVYFDRVHCICPMIHQRQYFSWARYETVSPARQCLRFAMRTLAAAMSPSHHDLVDRLYTQTRCLLEENKPVPNQDTSCPKSPDQAQIELIQAWLLLAHYESMRVNEWQAMLTAGYAFRLVQMARLYEIDKFKSIASGIISETSMDGDEFTGSEVGRRTFWVAYNLDCFLSWRSERPLTLYEDMVNTHLPAPEANFHNGQPIVTESLADALNSNEALGTSPFAECIVLATLLSRCTAHHRASLKESQTEPRRFWARHEWLSSAVEKRIELRAQSSATTAITTVERDPMLFFTHMLAHSAIITLGATVRGMSRQRAGEQSLMIPVHEQRANWATTYIVQLVKAFPSLSCFKAHPFLPIPLVSAIGALLEQNPKEGNTADVDTLQHLLTDLGHVNNLAQKIAETYTEAPP